MKIKLLIVYPHNFFEDKSGINTRYIELLKYFKSRAFKVDMLTLNNFKSSWANYPVDKGGFIDEFFFYDFNKGSRKQKFKNRKKNPLAWIRKKIPLCHAYTHLPDFAYPGMKKLFTQIVNHTHYDFILISYVYWANLVRLKPVRESITLLDLSDFITLNQFDRTDGSVKIGPMLEEEIRRINLFDKVMCISEEEKWFFSKFAHHPQYYYIPFFMEKRETLRSDNTEYDIVFIGSANPHNQRGVQWFFEKIIPLLSDSIRVLIVGPISRYINPLDNVTCISNVENPGDVYSRSKISICPLMGGTGLKIKVVEALSFGLPVVTTSKGIIGFPAKINTGCLVADSPGSFADSIHRLLSDETFYHNQRKRAIEFFMENFEKSTVYHRLDEIFSSSKGNKKK
jgi:glycosyltransferase involved in cell wall biosynthesis